MPSRRAISSIARNTASPDPNESHGSSSHPRSTHSMAKAIVPPALIVSMPTSSHSLRRAEHRVRVADAAQRAQREEVLVLEADAFVVVRLSPSE